MSSEMLRDTYWEVSESDFEGCENAEWGRDGEGTLGGTAARTRALRRDLDKALKDQEARTG